MLSKLRSRFRLFALIALLALSLGGCATYPLGMSEAEWLALTPEEQAAASSRQAEINAENRARQAAYEERQQRIAEERRIAAELAVQELYENPQYGDILEVTVQSGTVAFFGKNQPFEPVGFLIARGEVKPVTFIRQGRSSQTTTVWTHFDGATFYFDVGADFDPVRRTSRLERYVFVKTPEWEAGVTYTPENRERETVSDAEDLEITFRIRPDSAPRGRPRGGDR